MKNFSIAVDGPAGSGKSTISKKLAYEMDIIYVDTGAMYRAVGLFCLNNNIDTKDEKKVENILEKIYIDMNFENKVSSIFLNGTNVSKEIRSQKVSLAASDVAKIYPVREKLVEIQRNMSKNTSIIMDGRDIGTNVLPNAEIKIYLNANVEERTARRCHELELLNQTYDTEKIKQEILKRDESDINRQYNPLRKADDAIEIDTSNMSIEEVKNKIMDIIKEKIK